MTIYFVLIAFWIISYSSTEYLFRYNEKSRKKLSTFLMGSSLFLVMALKHYSVGVDTDQYLFRFNNIIYPLNISIFSKNEWLFHGFASILKNIGLNDQGYIAVYSLIICIIFSRFFYKYSSNVLFSFILHLTIGLFTMSMSGMRQMLAISLVLISFDYIVKHKPIQFFALVFLAFNAHASAAVFFPMYFFRNVKIGKLRGYFYLLIVISFIVLRKFAAPIFGVLSPQRFLDRYELFSSINTVNPLLVVISIAIPIASIILWKSSYWEEKQVDRLMSLFYIMTLFNALFNIFSLNSNMIGRLSYYFIPFVMVILPNIISSINDKKFRMIAYYFCLVLPLIQFIMATPGGTLRIDSYKFFWQ